MFTFWHAHRGQNSVLFYAQRKAVLGERLPEGSLNRTRQKTVRCLIIGPGHLDDARRPEVRLYLGPFSVRLISGCIWLQVQA